jgi:hypothetical protein
MTFIFTSTRLALFNNDAQKKTPVCAGPWQIYDGSHCPSLEAQMTSFNTKKERNENKKH